MILAARALPLAVSLPLFIELFCTSALAFSAPALAREFGADLLYVKMAMTGYFLATAIVLPASGWIADRLGTRLIFLAAFAVYILAMLFCALAPTLEVLLAARLLQGGCAGIIAPMGRLLLVRCSPKSQLVRAMNRYSLLPVIGPLAGPMVAGMLLEYANWRWTFLGALPLGLVGFAVVYRVVPSLLEESPGPFDMTGFSFWLLTICALVVSAEALTLADIPDRVAAISGLLMLGSSIILTKHLARAESPLLDLTPLRGQTFRLTLLGAMLMRLGQGATPFLLPLFLIGGLGWAPTVVGMVLAMSMAGSLVTRFINPWVVRRFGFRRIMLGTVLATGLLTLVPLSFTAATPVLLAVAVMFAIGFFRGVHFVTILPLSMSEVSERDMKSASVISSVMLPVGQCLGISIAALGLRMGWSGPASASQPGGYAIAIIALSVMGWLALLLFWRLRSDAGDALRNH